jgi:PAS domain S-box-containing protein
MSGKILNDSVLAPWLKQPVIWMVIACGMVLPFSDWLPTGHFFEEPSSYLPLHTTLEFFAIAVAIMIFAIVWHTREKHKDGRSLFLASVFLGVGLIDFMHTLSFFGMPTFITPSSTGKAISFWLAARLLAAVGFIGVALWTFEALSKKLWQALLFVLILSVVFMVGWVQLIHPELVPEFFIPGKDLTPLKVNMEYFISSLYLLAAVIMFYRSERATQRYWLFLGSAALVMMFSEFYFTLYAKVTDIYNLLGHVYKVIAYAIVYQAVFVLSVREPYLQVQRLQMQQEKISSQLREAQKIAHLGQWELEYPSYKLFWSEGIFELFEIDPTRFAATYEAFLAACHPDDRQKIDENFTASLRDRTPYDFVHRLMMPDGRIKWVKESGVTAYDNQGEPLFTKGVVIEVTDIMAMETSMRVSENYYRTVTESLPVPLAINDNEGNITFLNESFVLTFGYTRADIPTVSEWWVHAYPDLDYRASVMQQWMVGIDTLQQGLPFPVQEVNVTCKSGEIRTVLAHQANLSATEGLVYLYDITERKSLEIDAVTMREQLAQSTKMEAIGHLTAGVAHDFNNMLGAIMGYSELSQSMLKSGNTEKVELYQDEILKAGTRAKELIQQMLTFSRLSPEGAGVNVPAIGLSLIVKEVVSLLRSSIPRTVDLNYTIAADNLRACIQPVHLHQIILNLGINARDAMGEYGRIDITLSRQHIDVGLCDSCNKEYAGDFAEITVKDSGSGIPEPVLKKIFDPFFTTKGVGKGTGMGLSVVHGLVHGLGGHIQVRSSAENGTEFSILLPLSVSAVAAESAEEIHAPVNIKGVRIMLIDDESGMLAMLHESLAAQGAEIVSFSDPMLALGDFSQHPQRVDLVITDESMPGMSGMALAGCLLAVKPALPIILCTGYSDHANPEMAEKAGIAGFFYKPLKMDELLRKISSLLPVK